MMQHSERVIDTLVAQSLQVTQQFFHENKNLIAESAGRIAEGLRKGGKVLFFGNGGSAADAQHLAAEMVGRLSSDRTPLAAISL